MKKRIFRPPQSGTVYTPEPLALAIVRAVGVNDSASWLEPCIGNGALVKALHAFKVSEKNILAMDLEKRVGLYDEMASTRRGVDFLVWSAKTTKRFDRVVANPPYVSLRSLPIRLQRRAAQVLDPQGNTLSLRSNYWVCFLLSATRLLKPGGNIAFILPASFEFANYSKIIRDWLPNVFDSIEIHRCHESLFPEASDGCVVLLGFSYHTYSKPGSWKYQSYSRKTQFLFGLNNRTQSGQGAPDPNNEINHNRVLLKDVIDIRLGGVTGDTSYFLLTEIERKRLRLPIAAVKPVVTKSVHLTSSVLTDSEWQLLRTSGARVWLFSPPPRLIRSRYVWSYILNAGKTCNKFSYKVSNRHPWYKTPLPRGVHGFFSGMSRHGPWISFREKTGLNATNTLFVVRFRDCLSPKWQAAWALGLLTTKVREQFAFNARRYPDGLIKWEPRDLKDVVVPRPVSNTKADELYKKAIRALLKGRVDEAKIIADAFFGESQMIRNVDIPYSKLGTFSS